MERTQINGKILEYEYQGSGEPVMLIHGSHIADAFVPLLTESVLTEKYQLINYHRCGYAGSTHLNGPQSITQQAEDCYALMQHLSVSSAHVVGHSTGGPIALQLALDTPQTVHSLSLLEPALLAVPSTAKLMEGMGLLMQMYQSGNKAGAVDNFLQAIVGPEYRSVLDQVLPGSFEQAAADADSFFQSELPALEQWSFTESDASCITQPVLAVVGQYSHTVWPGWAEVHQLVQSLFPQAETLMLEDATHGLQMINPGGMAKGLAAFFARHPLS